MSGSEPSPRLETCPFCFSSAVEETLAVKEMCKGTRDVFHYRICRGCGSAYITDFPENIGGYYEGYYSFQEDDLTIDKVWWKRTIVNCTSVLW